MEYSKEQALTEVYHEVTSEFHRFRETMIRLLIALSTATIVWVSWFETLKAGQVTLRLRILLTAGAVILYGGSLLISRDLKKYFMQSASTVVKIENIWGFHKIGEYIPDETLMPAEWADFGTPKWKEFAFERGKQLICLMGLLVLFSIWWS